jgi:hypothetical protein
MTSPIRVALSISLIQTDRALERALRIEAAERPLLRCRGCSMAIVGWKGLTHAANMIGMTYEFERDARLMYMRRIEVRQCQAANACVKMLTRENIAA